MQVSSFSLLSTQNLLFLLKNNLFFPIPRKKSESSAQTSKENNNFPGRYTPRVSTDYT